MLTDTIVKQNEKYDKLVNQSNEDLKKITKQINEKEIKSIVQNLDNIIDSKGAKDLIIKLTKEALGQEENFIEESKIKETITEVLKTNEYFIKKVEVPSPTLHGSMNKRVELPSDEHLTGVQAMLKRAKEREELNKK